METLNAQLANARSLTVSDSCRQFAGQTQLLTS